MNIYGENILDHWKNPRNYGQVKHAGFVAQEQNVFCGDAIEISGKIRNGTIVDLKFRGSGCVISQAAASLLTERAKGKRRETVQALSIKDMRQLLGIPLGLTRTRCAELPLIALQKGLVLASERTSK